MVRKIVHIDEEKCDGCGLCVPSCAEGAIRIVNGKAVLSADNLCDGLGACLGDCPRDAIRVIEREADPFDESAVEKQLGSGHGSSKPGIVEGGSPHNHGGCPGSRVMTFEVSSVPTVDNDRRPSRLAQWPVQLHLVPVSAPYFQDADLLISADCVPFSYPEFHDDFLSGKALVIGCPKLDDNSFYQEKLTQIMKTSGIKSVTVLRMEVPCCGGIVIAARRALADSGREIPFREVVIGINGEIKGENG